MLTVGELRELLDDLDDDLPVLLTVEHDDGDSSTVGGLVSHEIEEDMVDIGRCLVLYADEEELVGDSYSMSPSSDPGSKPS